MSVLEKLFNTFLISTVIVGLIFLVFKFGPSIENNRAPVVSQVSLFYTTEEKDSNTLVVSGYVNIARDCEMRKVTAYLADYQDDTHKHDLVKLQIINKPEVKSKSEIGQHRWTLLIAVPSVYLDKENFLVLQTTHRCHGFWDLETEVMREPILSVMGQR